MEPVDRLTTFAVCFCGRLLHSRECETCGYVMPAERERRFDREMAAWRDAARRVATKRKRQAHARRMRARRGPRVG